MINDGNSFVRSVLAIGAGILMSAVVTIESEAATKVEEVVTPGGIHAYLVNEPAAAFISLALNFKGGAALDPAGKEGLANMVSGLIDEGAGPYDSQAFRAELEDNAIRLSFSADRDGFSGDLKTLNEYRDHAFELLRLALSEPRFDEEPVERIRQQIITGLKRRETDPDYLASRGWFEAAFPAHPYGRPTRGTIETIEQLTVDDLRTFVGERFGKDNLIVGVSGDISAEELAPLLDHAFLGLPAEAAPSEVPFAEPVVGEEIIVTMPIPQSVVTFGHGGLKREDPDYYAAYVANYILGGGGFSSRLTEEVREKRGLAYSVYSYLFPADHAAMWLGGVATKNDQVRQSIELIRKELAKMGAGDISETDLANAKTYLTGSFPLRLTSNDQVARMLVGMQLNDLGRNYIERRNSYIEAVTLDDVQRVAKRLFNDELLVTIVGNPTGQEG